jgi:hypothetical protein
MDQGYFTWGCRLEDHRSKRSLLADLASVSFVDSSGAVAVAQRAIRGQALQGSEGLERLRYRRVRCAFTFGSDIPSHDVLAGNNALDSPWLSHFSLGGLFWIQVVPFDSQVKRRIRDGIWQAAENRAWCWRFEQQIPSVVSWPRHRALVAAGSYSYGYDGNGYDANGNAITRSGNTIAWTSYNYPSQVNNGSEYNQFSYGPNRERWKQVYSGAGGTETTLTLGGGCWRWSRRRA